MERTKAPTNCPACRVDMTPGFFLDHGFQNPTQQAWVEGVPEESFWSGIKTSDRETYSVAAFRCGNCGRLDLFATEPVST